MDGRQMLRTGGFALAVVAAALLLGACELEVEPFVVNSTGNAVDVAPGDGVCETSNAGRCTLRAAVMEANALPGANTILLPFSGDSYRLGSGAGDDTAVKGDLDITESLTIRGEAALPPLSVGATKATIQPPSDRTFDVHAGTLVIVTTHVRGGVLDKATDGGGGAFRVADGAALKLLGTNVRGGSVVSGSGGIDAGVADIEVIASSIVETWGSTAGAVRTGGALRVEASTISTNHATAGPGGIAVVGAVPAQLHFSTVTANRGTTAGGVSGPVVSSGTAIVDQRSGVDCAQPLTSQGYNADSDSSCVDGSVTGDRPGVVNVLGAMLTATGTFHLPHIDSPLVDAVPPGEASCGVGLRSVDQRLLARPTDSDDDGAGACDIGAIERGSLLVNHGGDDVDSSPGDGICQDRDGPAGACSLRAAIREARTTPGRAVTVDPSVDLITLSRAGTREDDGRDGDLDVLVDLDIRGNGTTVEAGRLDRVFHIHSGTTRLEDLTITGGLAVADTGGGVQIEWEAALEAVRTTVADNEATMIQAFNTLGTHARWVGGFYCGTREAGGPMSCGDPYDVYPYNARGGGGGIWSMGTVHLVDSSVHGNNVTGGGCVATWDPFNGSGTQCGWAHGGGVFTQAGSMTNSTIHRNEIAYGTGAGLSVAAAPGSSDPFVVTASTITDNVIGSGGPTDSTQVDTFDRVFTTISPLPGAVVLHGAVVAGAGPQCTTVPGRVTSFGYNVDGDSTCGLTDPTDLPSFEPLLGLLADNGGPNLTLLPSSASPLVDAIPVGTLGLCDGTLPTDQRGLP